MATEAHCAYCFDALQAHLDCRQYPALEEVQESWADYVKALRGSVPADAPAASSSSMTSTPMAVAESSATTALVTSTTAEFPLFVTWDTLLPPTASTAVAPQHRELRGCIGSFESMPLNKGLSLYAVTAALHDSRFNPVDADELPSLAVTVTLLTDFETCADPLDWVLGQHGLRLAFVHHGRSYSATYLPDVAPEQGWSKEDTVVSLMHKAGWSGSRAGWRDVDLTAVRYQGRKASLAWSEYQKWRDWR